VLTWQLSAETRVPLARCAHADEFIEINVLGGAFRFARASRTQRGDGRTKVTESEAWAGEWW